MNCTLLVTLILAATAFGALAVSPSGHFEQRLIEAQRQGSCTELPQFGVNTHRGRNPDDVNVRLISEIDARMVRLEIPWADLERQGQYDFGPFDNLIEKLRQNNKSIVFGLAYGHPDHSDGRAENGFPLPPHTPEQRAAFDKYVQAVARQYHGPDIVYEIWNEPNLDLFWPPSSDANAYGELLADATLAIRDVEPTATIISGGLANENNPPQFLHALAAAGALDKVDGIAFHPYRQDGPENSLYDVAEFENAAFGRAARPLWITEWGYSGSWISNGDPSQVETRLANMTARLMLTAALSKAKAALIYDLIDDGADLHDQESSFGLYDYNFKPKKAAAAFRILAGLMSGCNTYEFSVDTAQNIITGVFQVGSVASYVVWNYAVGRPRSLCFIAAGSRPTGLNDILGNPLPLESCGTASQVRLELSETSGPVILQAEGSLNK